MTIPVQQTTAWSRYPTPIRSGWAHAAVKSAILIGGRFQSHVVDVYVQGSYKNLVNVRSDSDVDIVAELSSVAFFDTSQLQFREQSAFWASIGRVDYDYVQFRMEVHELLKARFGPAVTPHSKAIEVEPNWRRLKVDVLPAMLFRQIYAFDGSNMMSTDGICFWTSDGRQVINWPKQHLDNGTAKNEATGGHFRPSVRMFKNARAYAVARGLLSPQVAPSYFLQCLLANVPDVLFGPDRSSTYLSVLNWLNQNRHLLRHFRCQNGIQPLFGFSPEQWQLDRAFATVDSLGHLWNNWQ